MQLIIFFLQTVAKKLFFALCLLHIICFFTACAPSGPSFARAKWVVMEEGSSIDTIDKEKGTVTIITDVKLLSSSENEVEFVFEVKVRSQKYKILGDRLIRGVKTTMPRRIRINKFTGEMIIGI
jgi:hypothetical protein